MATYIDVSNKISIDREVVTELAKCIEQDFWNTITETPESYKDFLFSMNPGKYYVKDDVDKTIKSLRFLKVVDDDKSVRYEAFVMIFFLGVVLAEYTYELPEESVELDN